jgi:hypothetical protein
MRQLLIACVSFAVVLTACGDGTEAEPAVDEAPSDRAVDELEVADDEAEDLDELLKIKEELEAANSRFADLHSASLRGDGCRYEEDRTMAAIERLDVGLPSAEFRTALDDMRVAAALLAVTCRTGGGAGETQSWFDAAGSAELALERLIIDAGG